MKTRQGLLSAIARTLTTKIRGCRLEPVKALVGAAAVAAECHSLYRFTVSGIAATVSATGAKSTI